MPIVVFTKTMPGHRTDLNHDGIRRALRKAGACWLDMTQACGSPIHCDAVVLHAGRIYFVEVKRAGHALDLTPPERAFHAACREAGVKVHVIQSAEEALAMIGAYCLKGFE